MVFHPPGIVVKIVGTEANDQGRSCEEHPTFKYCGKVLEPDVVWCKPMWAKNVSSVTF